MFGEQQEKPDMVVSVQKKGMAVLQHLTTMVSACTTS